MNAAAVIGAVASALALAILKFAFSRIDKSRKENREIKIHPPSGRRLNRFRDWVRDKKNNGGI